MDVDLKRRSQEILAKSAKSNEDSLSSTNSNQRAASQPAVMQLDECSHIVIGSGMGGGMVARQLIENGNKVGIIEKGGVPFFTHCLNTSRPHFDHKSQYGAGRDNEVVFQNEHVRTPYDTQEGEKESCSGGSVFALGGRSVLWSLEAPEIEQKTAKDNFPKEVTEFLYGPELTGGSLGSYGSATKPRGYSAATRIMENSPPGDPQYHKNRSTTETAKYAISKLQKAIKVEDVALVPIGAEFAKEASLYYFPRSAYSTVDYLFDRALNPDRALSPDRYSSILVGVEAFRLRKENEKVVGLEVIDAEGNTRTIEVKNKQVVLCAGTVNTAAIALRSGLDKENRLVGQGLTDHEVWMARYWKDSKPAESKEQPVEISGYVDVHGRRALLTVCTHAEKLFSHGFATIPKNQKVEPVAPANVLSVMLAFEAKLNEDGKVSCGQGFDAPKLEINRKRLDESEQFETALKNLTKNVRMAFGFDKSEDHPVLQNFGSVAHEVGTMRMDAPGKPGVVDKNLKVHGLDNLYVCDLSVFPFSPAASPSLTLTALAMRLGDHLTA